LNCSRWAAHKEIANRLGLSTRTVRWHLENIYGKLHVNSRSEAILKFYSTNVSHKNEK